MSDFEDGWGDDDDLDLDLDDTNEIDENVGNAEGWDDDDDLFDDGDDNETDGEINFGTAKGHDTSTFGGLSRNVTHPADDGGGKLQSFGNFGIPQGGPPARPTIGTSMESALSANNLTPASAADGGTGWDSDDDLFDVDAADDNARQGDHHTQTQPHIQETPPSSNPPLQQSIGKLEEYVAALEMMLPSINAVLESEYNTTEKAEELVLYYTSRPQLAEYTRTKELPRMDYRIVLPHGDIEMDKERIARYLPDTSLVSRCANQSLLADLLQVITGPDLLVRPQFLATCIANKCQFTIHFGDQEDVVDCSCHLHLSFPTEQGERLNVAELNVSIIFCPDRPTIEYRVHRISVLLQDKTKLASTASFLSMMEMDDDPFGGQTDGPSMMQNSSADVFRDAFVANSQMLFSKSTSGMKSALEQVDAVVNFQRKLDVVKSGYNTIAKLMPDTDGMLQAEQEATALAESQVREMAQQRQQQRPVPPPPPPPPPPVGQIPPPGQQHHSNRVMGPPPTTRPSEDSTARPKSILGGLVSSGWNALAKTVAMPDVDPDIYGHHPDEGTTAKEGMGAFGGSDAFKHLAPESAKNRAAAPVPQPPTAASTQAAPTHRAPAKPFPSQPPAAPSRLPPPPPQQRLTAGEQQQKQQQQHQQHIQPGQGRKNLTVEGNEENKPTEVKREPKKSVATADNLSPAPPAAASAKGDTVMVSRGAGMSSAAAAPVAATTTPTIVPGGNPPHEEKQEFQADEEDGWDDEDIDVSDGDDDDDKDDDGHEQKQQQKEAVVQQDHSTMDSGQFVQGKLPTSSSSSLRKSMIINVEYNIEDDIIETRRRWINSRPCRK